MPKLYLIGTPGIFLRQINHLAESLDYQPHVCATPEAVPNTAEAVFVCYEDPTQRVTTVHACSHLPIINLIHPSAVISPTAQLGLNIFADALVIIGMQAQLGDGVVLNSRATVEHDNVLKDGVFLGTGATLCGHVQIDAGAFLGGGITVKPGCHIHQEITVGTGAVVVNDLTEAGTYVGNPAKRLFKNTP